MDAHGVTFFWHLIELLYERVHNEGIDKFCDLITDFIWNFSTWLRIILNIAAGVNTDPTTNDCVLSTSKYMKNGYTSICHTVGRYRFVDTKEHTRVAGKIRFQGKENKKKLAARLICALKNGCPKLGDEASHLCANNPQTCIKSEHVKWESKQLNMSRQICVNGCAYYCKHSVKCVYTDKNGKWLSCRNSEESPLCSCENQYCRNADILKPGMF